MTAALSRLEPELGRGAVCMLADGLASGSQGDRGAWPRWPMFVTQEDWVERCMTCPATGVPTPLYGELPIAIERKSDARGDNYFLLWRKKVQFDDGLPPTQTKWFSTKKHGEAEAERLVWLYLNKRYEAGQEQESPYGRGKVGAATTAGKVFHGEVLGHRFEWFPAPTLEAKSQEVSQLGRAHV